MTRINELDRGIADLSKTEIERTKEIHNKSIVIDASEVLRLDSIAFPRRKKGGITAINAACPYPYNLRVGPIEAYRDICEHRSFINYYKDKALLALTAEDIRKAKKEDKLAVILGAHDCNPLIEEVEDVAFHKWAGLRIIEIVCNYRNAIGDGCAERTDSGLSKFGVEVVEEMDKQGIVVDLSHCGDKTTLDAIEVSKNPCIFSHANVRSIQDQVRNKSDEAIQALAEKGGAIAIFPFAPCLHTGDNQPKIEDVYAHVKYVEDLVGVDHIALAADINERRQPGTPPTGDTRMEFTKIKVIQRFHGFLISPPPEAMATWPSVSDAGFVGYGAEEFQNFTKVLVAGGYSDHEIEKILGGNLLRVFKQVWGK